MSTIKNKEDIKREIIDTNAYIADLVGEDRLIDRMIIQLARAMGVGLDSIPKSLGIKHVTRNGSSLLDSTADLPPVPAKKELKAETSLNGQLGQEVTAQGPVTGKEGQVTVSSASPRPRKGKTLFDYLPSGGKKGMTRKKSKPAGKKKRRADKVELKSTRMVEKRAEKSPAPSIRVSTAGDGLPLFESTVAEAGAAAAGIKSIQGAITELFHCPECDLTFELNECDGNKCPLCATTVVYVY